MSDYDENYSGTAIHLIDGEEFDFEHPEDTEITLHTIAHSLARVNRYGGHHAAENYSVAEHAVVVSYIVEKFYKEDKKVALAALHHDDAEAFTGDLPTPFKNFLKSHMAPGFWQEMESRLMVPISSTFNIPPDDFHTAVIKDADVLAYAAEITVLKPKGHGAVPEVDSEILSDTCDLIQGLPAHMAEQSFRMRHLLLTGQARIRVLEMTDSDETAPDAELPEVLPDDNWDDGSSPFDPRNM